MVFEGRLAELLQNQASRFLHGLSAEQLRLGLLSGSVELCNVALNPEPLDSLFLESEAPLVMKAGVLTSVVAQLSLLQGELELTIDGLLLVLSPACRWLAREEVAEHRDNEIQRLEFVHMRSQSQRRTLERNMFRQVFVDYLSRVKVTLRNLHVRVEIEGEGVDSVYGVILDSCAILPQREACAGLTTDKDGEPGGSELLVAERVEVRGLSFHQEHDPRRKPHTIVSQDVYEATRRQPHGVFSHVGQEEFVRQMHDLQARHASVAISDQLMPPTSFTINVDLRSQPLRDSFHLDSCLTMDVAVHLETPSQLKFSVATIEHVRWFVHRLLDFQLWQFLHTLRERPRSAASRWAALRHFMALKRRIHSNTYTLREAIAMRVHCKEYVRLYKRKFNGPASVAAWRKTLPSLEDADVQRLSDLELMYPADKLVNFRLMAHNELKTEMALNSFLNTDDVGGPAVDCPSDPSSPYRRTARELTPMEQLHLHGQHGYGVNIYRGMPPPPSSLKIRIDVQAPAGLWWVCSLSGIPPEAPKAQHRGAHGRWGRERNTAVGLEAPRTDEAFWALALDCAAQPVRVSLVDSIVDTSVLATLEVPAVDPGQRPLALLLGRTEAAFASGSPGRGGAHPDATHGGRGASEWLSVLELHGTVYCCSQAKTILLSSTICPWDVFVHFSCGDIVDTEGSDDHLSFDRMELISGAGDASGASGTKRPNSIQESACVRLRVPLELPSGQPGPLAEMVKRCSAFRRGSDSVLGWFARQFCRTYQIAAFRSHVRLPPTVIDAGRADARSFCLPRLDAACHLDHGGLIDGFVVGLHNLYHFMASVLPGSPSAGERSHAGSGGIHRGSGSWPPLSLQPLEDAPPAITMLSALLAALAIVLAAGRDDRDRGASLSKEALLVPLQRSGLANLVPEGAKAADSPAALVSLVLVVLAVCCGRRALWDLRDSKLTDHSKDSPDLRAADAALAEVFSLFGAMLSVLLHMGFPLHVRCAPLAAWAGALEILQVMGPSVESAGSLPYGLVTAAARGFYANLPGRQCQTLRWLFKRGARIDECDRAGRSLLDWASWCGQVEAMELALRAGLLSPFVQRPKVDPQVLADMAAEAQAAEAAGGLTTGRSPSSLSSSSPGGRTLPASRLPPSMLQPLSTHLSLAVAGRSPDAVRMLLRAACDPHAPSRSGGCSPLLLALRSCEYELACELVRGAPFVAVEAALGTAHSSSPPLAKGDVGIGGDDAVACSRATAALLESFRRFAGVLARRASGEEASGASALHAGGLRVHSPGPHVDDGLYGAGQLGLGDILHPLLFRLPLPVHRVGYEQRPHQPPLHWLLRNRSANPWGPPELFMECCVRRGFRFDGAVVARLLPNLSPEAQGLVWRVLGRDACLNPDDAPTLASLSSVMLGDADEGQMLRGMLSADPSTVPEGSCDTAPLMGPSGHGMRQTRAGRRRSNDSVPPIDLAAALGGRGHHALAPVNEGVPQHQQHEGASREEPYAVHVPPDTSVVWLTVTLGAAPVAFPQELESLSVDCSRIRWSLRVKPEDRVGGLHSSLVLGHVRAVRPFELSTMTGAGVSGARHVVEVRLGEDFDATALAKALLSSAARGGGAELARLSASGGNGAGHHTLRFIFAREGASESFAAAVSSKWRNYDPAKEELIGGTLASAIQEDVPAYLQGSPWDITALLSDLPAHKKKGSGALNGVALPAGKLPREYQPPQLPAVRVVVLGPPRVGKTRVSNCLAAELNASTGSNGHGHPDVAWLRTLAGSWPPGAPARAQVHIWDAPAAPLPGLLSRLTADPAAPILAIGVVDASLAGVSTQADALLGVCNQQLASSSLVAPRRAIVVENVFEGAAEATRSKAQLHSQVVQCNISTPAGASELCKAFGGALAEMVGQLEARAMYGEHRGVAKTLAAGSPSDWYSRIALCPCLLPLGLALNPGGDSALASHLRGDSALLDPSLVTWAWAAMRAAQASLTEGISAGGALVPWERLERVLGSLGGQAAGGSLAAPALLRALADMCLVCPIPSSSPACGNSSCLDCSWLLVPDFAKRVRLASGASGARLSESSAAGSPFANDGGSAVGGSETSSPTAVWARLSWDSHSSSPLKLRAVLRDFLARGVLGHPDAAGAARFIQVHRFSLLEAGPDGAPGLLAADDLAPGFLLAFDLVSEGSQVTSPSNAMLAGGGGGTSRGPFGMSDDDALGAAGSVSPSPQLTAIIIGASAGSAGAGGRGTAAAPYWDVYCTGPHAVWAWRALLGSGTSGPQFSAFNHSRRSRQGPWSAPGGGSSGGSSGSTAWPLPTPACVVSTSSVPGAPASGGQPTSVEFMGLSWLFNGPHCAPTRAALLPPGAPGASRKGGGLAACCAVLCRRGPSRHGYVSSGLEDDVVLEGLSSCADFEASLLARSWQAAPRLLDEILAGGVEAWTLCAAALARVAHDAAASAAGARGRALPLLGADPRSDCQEMARSGMWSLVLVHEGPQPLTVRASTSTPENPECATSLGTIRASAGVQAWLRVCKPIVLWNAAGNARGYVSSADEPSTAMSSGEGSNEHYAGGSVVVKALQSALAVQLTEAMVSEVWDALLELASPGKPDGDLRASRQRLMQRPCGTWAHVVGDRFVL